MKTSSVIVSLLLALFAVSCKKMQANKLEGTYSCMVDYHYWQMSNPVYTKDTTYQYDIEVEREKDSMNIGGQMVPFREILDGKLYTWGGYHYNGDVLFRNDSMYLYQAVLLGLGGGSNTTCACSLEK